MGKAKALADCDSRDLIFEYVLRQIKKHPALLEEWLGDAIWSAYELGGKERSQSAKVMQDLVSKPIPIDIIMDLMPRDILEMVNLKPYTGPDRRDPNRPISTQPGNGE